MSDLELYGGCDVYNDGIRGGGIFVPKELNPPGLTRALLFSLPSYASFPFCVYLLLATCPALSMDSWIGLLS